MVTIPVQSYRELCASIQSEKDQRIQEHQACVAKIGRMAASMFAGQQRALNLIGQGDSWFDYPFPIPVIDQTDVPAHLKRLPAMTPEVLSLAHHGEAAEDMLGFQKPAEMFSQTVALTS